MKKEEKKIAPVGGVPSVAPGKKSTQMKKIKVDAQALENILNFQKDLSEIVVKREQKKKVWGLLN